LNRDGAEAEKVNSPKATAEGKKILDQTQVTADGDQSKLVHSGKNSMYYRMITEVEERNEIMKIRVVKNPSKVNYSDIEAFYKIVLIGDCDVGKTSLLLRYADDIFSHQPTTVGVDFKIKTLKVDKKIIKI
jgi:hypothetical protein